MQEARYRRGAGDLLLCEGHIHAARYFQRAGARHRERQHRAGEAVLYLADEPFHGRAYVGEMSSISVKYYLVAFVQDDRLCRRGAYVKAGVQ